MMIAKALRRSTKTICRCRAHLGVEGVGTPPLTEKEKDLIIKYARKGWTTTKIAAAVQRSHSSVTKVCRASGITMSKKFGGKNDSARLRALSFLGLGYSAKKVAKIVCVDEDLVRHWATEDVDTKLPARRVSKSVKLNWVRIEDVDGTETWQCRGTMRQVSLTMREAKSWLVLDPWIDEVFKSREDALNAARRKF